MSDSLVSNSLYAAMLDRARQAYEAARYDECSQHLRIALLQFPDDGRLIELQGLVWYAQGDFAAASRALETAALLVSLSMSAQLALAHGYLRGGKKGDAQTILRFLAARPDLPTPLLPQLCVGLGRAGEYQLALDTCREASLRDPESDEAVYGMAFYMSKLGYPPECILPLLRRALALEPARPIYRLGLAVACAKFGHVREAYDLFCGLDIEQVNCPRCLDSMATVCSDFGDKRRFKSCRDKILQISARLGRPAPFSRSAADRAREAG